MGKYADYPKPGLSRQHAALYLRMALRDLDALRAVGQPPGHFLIGHEVRYWPGELDRYIACTPSRPLLNPPPLKFKFDAHFELVPDVDLMLSSAMLAKALGVCDRTVCYWRSQGRGPVWQIVDDQYWYTGAAVRAYIRFEQQGPL